MFSVIIPLYNKAPYVAKAIESVLNQTFREFEVIVVNDGSQDNSLEEVRKFTDSRLSIINQENSGVSTARNNGVKQAKYPYVCFLDADDWWANTFLEEMEGLITEFPDFGIYGTSYYIVKNGKNRVAPIGVSHGFERGVIDYCKVYAETLCMPLTSISIAMPKTVFESENGFKPALKLGEDFDLWVRVALKHKVAFLNKPLAYYNQDVEAANRAVGTRLYKPHEHMLFTDYGDMMNNPDFRFLFERLALYGLLPYYLSGNNLSVINHILSEINWKRHEAKYCWYYKRLPHCIVKKWFFFLKKISQIKNKITK